MAERLTLAQKFSHTAGAAIACLTLTGCPDMSQPIPPPPPKISISHCSGETHPTESGDATVVIKHCRVATNKKIPYETTEIVVIPSNRRTLHKYEDEKVEIKSKEEALFIIPESEYCSVVVYSSKEGNLGTSESCGENKSQGENSEVNHGHQVYP